MTTEFDEVFQQLESPDYPATCNECGMEGTNASLEEHVCTIGTMDGQISLIDAAKQVESWWLELDKNAHNFYGAPGCIFALRAALETETGQSPSQSPVPRAGEGDRGRLNKNK